MTQAKFSLTDENINFLNKHKIYGFKDKSAVIRIALELLQKELEREKLKKSADLYAEIYKEDQETRELTESAISGWPE